jgi:hypothetical protein
MVTTTQWHPPPFAGAGAFGGIGQEMLQGAEQKVSESAAHRISPVQRAFLD